MDMSTLWEDIRTGVGFKGGGVSFVSGRNNAFDLNGSTHFVSSWGGPAGHMWHLKLVHQKWHLWTEAL
jgi:hypothetical protein